MASHLDLHGMSCYPFMVFPLEKAFQDRLAVVKPFMPNVFSHPYKLDESISNFRVVGWYFSFLFKFKRNFCKQAVENLIRCRILRFANVPHKGS